MAKEWPNRASAAVQFRNCIIRNSILPHHINANLPLAIRLELRFVENVAVSASRLFARATLPASATSVISKAVHTR
jgi:hypothetical protein